MIIRTGLMWADFGDTIGYWSKRIKIYRGENSDTSGLSGNAVGGGSSDTGYAWSFKDNTK
jgi:hypothetical protein